MFFEEIKQIVSTFREAVNLFLSRIFNKGVPIAEDMTTLILIGFANFYHSFVSFCMVSAA